MGEIRVIFGQHDDAVLDQLRNCVEPVEGAVGVQCADGQLGYGQSVGGAAAYPHHISLMGVGYDIACGNKAIRTNVRVADMRGGLERIMDEIWRTIRFGIGYRNSKPVADHEVIDRIRMADYAPVADLVEVAHNQLGSVGAGNHYVDLFEGEDGQLWIGVHFGSRGFGHMICNGFLSMYRELERRAAGQGSPEKSIESFFHAQGQEPKKGEPAILFDVREDFGRAYLEAMHLAGEYAYAGRDWVCNRVLEILGARADFQVHNHHNFAWHEQHDDGQWYWIARKGCTPAFPGQMGFVGSTMGEISVILKGNDTELSRKAMFSTIHGAGRVMSRTAAAGKRKRRQVRGCNVRDCAYETIGDHEPCPDHPDAGLSTYWRDDIKSPGRINWDEAREAVRARGIELRGGAADEAPGAYKRLTEVLAEHGDTIDVVHTLEPIGVAMAAGGRPDD